MIILKVYGKQNRNITEQRQTHSRHENTQSDEIKKIFTTTIERNTDKAEMNITSAKTLTKNINNPKVHHSRSRTHFVLYYVS